jgi:phage FluMu gp28-like protein
LAKVPKDKREALAEELSFKYPTWFFELYTELGGKPLVLEQYQIDYLLDRNTFTIMNKSRQAGGSLVVALKKFYTAYRNEAYRCDIISINLKEATDKIKYIKMIHESLPDRLRIPLTINNQTSVGFHKGMKQSVVNSLAASAGVRGGRKDIVFDEFAHIQNAEELYYAAAPAIMRGNLGVDIVSTPRGNTDMFSRIWKNAPDQDGEYPFSDYSRHEFIWCDVHDFTTNYEGAQDLWKNKLKKNMKFMDQVVAEYGTPKLKSFAKGMPWNQFLQEFCGVFLDESTAFFSQALIDSCLRPPYAKADEYEEKEYLDPWIKRPKDNHNQVFMGVDYGESAEETDKTSIQILEKDETGRLMHRYSEVLSKDQYPDFPSQARHIVDVYHKFKPNKVSADHTGLGRGINPQVRELCPDMPLEEVTFDYVNKEQMTMKLKTLMEQGLIWLQQRDIALQGEIRNIERKLTAAGRATYHGHPHDDMYWALCLAARAGGYSDFAIYTIGSGSRWEFE